MKVRNLLALSLALSFSSAAFAAEDGEAIFKKSPCASCHKVDVKLIGPSFKSIASKYAGDGAAQTRLEKKVRSGGSGSFGPMSMPPAPASVSDADIKTIVKWALSQK